MHQFSLGALVYTPMDTQLSRNLRRIQKSSLLVQNRSRIAQLAWCIIMCATSVFPLYSDWCAADSVLRSNMLTCNSQCPQMVQFKSTTMPANRPSYLNITLNIVYILSDILSLTIPLVFQLPCGHRCSKLCHAGQCISTNQCRRKVTVRCPCHRFKKVSYIYLDNRYNSNFHARNGNVTNEKYYYAMKNASY